MITLHKNIIQSSKFCTRVPSTLNILPRSQCILSSTKTKASSPAGAVWKPPPPPSPPLQKGRFAATGLLTTTTSAKHKSSQSNRRVGVKCGGSSRQHQWQFPSSLKGWGGSVTYWILNSRNLRSEEFYFLTTSGSLETEDPAATLISDGWICAIHRKGCALWDRTLLHSPRMISRQGPAAQQILAAQRDPLAPRQAGFSQQGMFASWRSS